MVYLRKKSLSHARMSFIYADSFDLSDARGRAARVKRGFHISRVQHFRALNLAVLNKSNKSFMVMRINLISELVLIFINRPKTGKSFSLG